MLTPARVLGVLAMTVLLSGCGLRALWTDVPAPAPVFTPASPTPVPDERTTHPYTGALAANATCERASKALLSELEDANSVGGAVTYPQGIAVRSNARWWTVAVRTAVDPHGSVDPAGVPAYEVFATNSPSHTDDWAADIFTWLVTDESSAASAKAVACLEKLPPVKVKTPRPVTPDRTYSGKPAPGATCRDVSAELLGRLQEAGQVGGAITYPRGQMVRANRAWWTVAVATAVHPNGEGYTAANVPAVAYFVTNAPSVHSASGVYTFPIKGTDKAARKAVACLG